MNTAAGPVDLELTPGLRQAAVTLVSLGKEHAAKVLSHMETDEIAQLGKAVLAVGTIPAEEVRATLFDLADGMGQLSALTAPKHDWLAETLNDAVGPERGSALLADITRPAPFAWASEADPDALARVLENEKAGSVAIALAHVPAELGAALFKRLSAPQRAAVAKRVAALDGLTDATVRDIDAALFEQVGKDTSDTRVHVDGLETITALLTRSPRSTTDAVLEQLSKTDPVMAAKVKEAMFTFDDVLALEGRSVQRVLNEVEVRVLAVAIFGASQSTIDAVFANLPDRKATILREEVESASGVRTSDVRAARAEIVTKALEMDAEGTIVIDFGPDEEEGA